MKRVQFATLAEAEAEVVRLNGSEVPAAPIQSAYTKQAPADWPYDFLFSNAMQ